MAVRNLFLFILFGEYGRHPLFWQWPSWLNESHNIRRLLFVILGFCKIYNPGRAQTSETSSWSRTVSVIWLSTAFCTELILSYTISLIKLKENGLWVLEVLVKHCHENIKNIMELVFAQPPVFSQVIHIKVSFNKMQLQTSFKKENYLQLQLHS